MVFEYIEHPVYLSFAASHQRKQSKTEVYNFYEDIYGVWLV